MVKASLPYLLVLAGIVATVMLTFLYGGGTNQLAAWQWSMAVTAILLLVLGLLMRGDWRGIFINEAGRISLSRFQLILWTVVLLPALVVAAASHAGSDITKALDFKIPSQIWVLLGISVASAAGAKILNTTKGDANQLSVTNHAVKSLSDAAATDVSPSWADLFRGDQKDDDQSVDISRVQTVFFTVVAVLVYAGVLAAKFKLGQTVNELPAVSDGLNVLLGISHAGYLAGKAGTISPGQKASGDKLQQVVEAPRKTEAARSIKTHIGMEDSVMSHKVKPDVEANAVSGVKTVKARVETLESISVASLFVNGDNNETILPAEIQTDGDGNLRWILNLHANVSFTGWKLFLTEDGKEDGDPDASGTTNQEGRAFDPAHPQLDPHGIKTF